MYHFDGMDFSRKGVDFKIIGTEVKDGETIDTIMNIETKEKREFTRQKLGELLINTQ